MNDEIESLLIEVRAGTQGFSRDIAAMRGSVDTDLVGGFTKAGDALEKGLSSAIRRGSLSFGDLKRSAMGVFDEIAQQGLATLASALGGGGGSGGVTGSLVGIGTGIASSLLGLPGRATGGNVSPGRGYVVGERGPELFVPTSAGRVESAENTRGGGRDVRVAINLNTPRGTSAPQSLQRSSRQVASAVRRAIAFG